MEGIIASLFPECREHFLPVMQLQEVLTSVGMEDEEASLLIESYNSSGNAHINLQNFFAWLYENSDSSSLPMGSDLSLEEEVDVASALVLLRRMVHKYPSSKKLLSMLRGAQPALYELERQLTTGASTALDMNQALSEHATCQSPAAVSHGGRCFVGESSPSCVRILSYNLLADMYAVKGLKHARHCTPEALAWTARKQRLLVEIASYNADVVCLQEVQANHYEEDISPSMSAKGYTGIFCLRTPWERAKDGHPEDGVALFWKQESLGIEQQSTVLYSYLANASSSTCSQNSQSHIDNVAKEKGALIVTLLRHRVSGKHLLVANTHLYHNPRHADIKVSQAYMAATHMRNFEHMHRCVGVPSVLCGDFNSQPQLNRNEIDFNPNDVSLTFRPGEASGVYELLSTGGLSVEHMHHPASWNPAKNSSMQTMELPEKRSFSSAHKVWLGVEPLFTTKTDGFTETIDYIWLSSAATESLCGILSGIPVDDKAAYLESYQARKIHGRATFSDVAAAAKDSSDFPSGMPNVDSSASDHMAIGCVIRM